MTTTPPDLPNPYRHPYREDLPAVLPHSKLGVLTFAASLLLIAGWWMLFGYAGDLRFQNAGEAEMLLRLVGILTVAGVVLNLVVVVMGIVACCLREVRKVFAVLGLVLALLPLVLIGLLVGAIIVFSLR